MVVNYGSNEEAAKKFSDQTNIETYKCDVGDFNSCSEMISKIYEKHKTIDILVNNAGITRDAPLHKMIKKTGKSYRCQSKFSFQHTSLVINKMRKTIWTNCSHFIS